jgi:hypothetical protein
VFTFKENCPTAFANTVSRFGISNNAETEPTLLTDWGVDLFPNPATSELNIVSKTDSEVLTIVIRDVTGKLLLSKNLITTSFSAKLDLNLINGLYLVSRTSNSL